MKFPGYPFDISKRGSSIEGETSSQPSICGEILVPHEGFNLPSAAIDVWFESSSTVEISALNKSAMIHQCNENWPNLGADDSRWANDMDRSL